MHRFGKDFVCVLCGFDLADWKHQQQAKPEKDANPPPCPKSGWDFSRYEGERPTYGGCGGM